MTKAGLLRKVTELEKALKEFSLETEFSAIRKSIDKMKFEKKEKSSKGELVLSEDWKKLKNTTFLFTDGACRGNPGPGAWAFVVQNHKEEVLAKGAAVANPTTNNQMEMMSVIMGLEHILDNVAEEESRTIYLSSDSQYVINGMKSWMEGWKKRGWKKADNKTPENVELWQRLDELMSSFKRIEYFWVKGHAGHPQNELCDQMANQALDDADF